MQGYIKRKLRKLIKIINTIKCSKENNRKSEKKRSQMSYDEQNHYSYWVGARGWRWELASVKCAFHKILVAPHGHNNIYIYVTSY